MNIVERVKKILMSPKTEWDVIAAEATPPMQLITTYVLPLAAIGAIASFIGTTIFASFFGGASFLWGLVGMVWHLVMAVISVLLVGFVIDFLAPKFAGQKNFNQAFKVAVYSYTAAFLGAVFLIIPILGALLALLAAIYSLYLMYLGLPKLMKNPDDKTIVYEIVVIVALIIVSWILFFIGALMTGGALVGSGMMRGSTAGPAVAYQRSESARKLDEFAKKMEEAGKKMEEAQKSGDPNKQMEAAMATLGTAMSGGKGVEPVQIDALKPFVPDTFVGLPRKDMRTERGGAAGFVTAKAEGVYNDDAGKNADLSVVDTGGMAGLMGVAAWMNVQGERENADRRESTRKEGKRFVHEEQNKREGGTSKYTVVLNDRFIVEARGNVDFGKLKSAVNGLDLGKLESLK